MDCWTMDPLTSAGDQQTAVIQVGHSRCPDGLEVQKAGREGVFD